ncbi:MAG: hypothetical protein AB7G47_10210 [Mycolicibacterium sp.]|uniref:hypothetical protein n=1 Tax=Mycolicibacterium sp. TaxID=2320850 RepID=UPI003D12DD9C
MYQLTITVEDTTSTTPFDSLVEARQALMSHVIAQDLYLHPTRSASPNAPSFRNAISAGRNATRNSAGELAAAVETEPSTEITAHQTAALIWYYALIVWAVNAS